jgi:hypothetical protein
MLQVQVQSANATIAAFSFCLLLLFSAFVFVFVFVFVLVFVCHTIHNGTSHTHIEVGVNKVGYVAMMVTYDILVLYLMELALSLSLWVCSN